MNYAELTGTDILMLERADEIQALKKCHCRPDSVNMPWWDWQGNCWFNRNNEKTIWLPTQKQLQDIIKDKTKPDWQLAVSFADWCSTLPKAIPNAFASMEQLWLRFIMQRKYNKVWNGKDWEKERLCIQIPEQELSIDILDACIVKLNELRDVTPLEMRINPTTWRKSTDAMRTLVGKYVIIPEDVCFGLPVIATPDVPEDEVWLVYSGDNFVKVKNVGAA